MGREPQLRQPGPLHPGTARLMHRDDPAVAAHGRPPRRARPGQSYVTGYSVGAHVIYAAFAGSVGAEAYDATFGLARKRRAGFYDVSGDDGGVLPWTPPAA
jgi:hypothetical protein